MTVSCRWYTRVMSIEAPEDGPRSPELKRWMDDVRDPADAATEGIRTIQMRDAEADYEVAPLPDGRWAVKVRASYAKGNCASLGTPWRAFDTREECLAYFLETARGHFAEKATAGRVFGQEAAARQMTSLLSGYFREPVPVPRPEEDPDVDHVERMRRSRRKELMEKFPLFAEEIEEEK